MAKKDNEALYQDFLADLKKINPKIEEVLDDATNAKLKDSVLARAEFSRQSDALAAREREIEGYLASETQKIEGWQKWYGDVTKEVANTQNQLKEYRDAYGELDSTSRRVEAERHGMTTADFEKALDKRLSEREQIRDAASISFVDELTDLKIEHRDRFKENLDTTSVFKLAGAKNLPLKLAYNEFIGDRVTKLNEQNVLERIEQAKKDAVAEFATQHKLPVLDSSRDYVHAADATPAMTDPNARVASAVADFMKRQR